METYQDALAATRKNLEKGYLLSTTLCEMKQLGVTDSALTEQLKHILEKWDQCATEAVHLAPDLESFRAARRLAPADGQAQTAYPNYLQ